MDELDALSDGLSADGSTLTADLRAVNDQMNVVVNLCLDIFVDMTDADASDIFEDTSDENIDAVTFGKVRELHEPRRRGRRPECRRHRRRYGH